MLSLLKIRKTRGKPFSSGGVLGCCLGHEKPFYSFFNSSRRSTLGVTVLEQSVVAVGGFDGSIGLCSAEAFDPRQGFSSV